MGRKVLAFVLLAGMVLATAQSLSAGAAGTARAPERMSPRPDVREGQGRRRVIAIINVVDAPSWVKLHSRVDTLYAPPGPEGYSEVTLPFDVASNGLLNQSGAAVMSIEWALTPDCRPVGEWKEPLTVAVPIGKAGEVVLSVSSIYGSKQVTVAAKHVDLGIPLPWETTLLRNFPNPFCERTELGFYLASPSKVSLGIYDRAGRLVATLLNADEKPGYYPFIWDGCDRDGKKVASGVYFYRLVAGDLTATRKMVLLR